MARQILPLAGQIIGGMIGGPVGAAIGGAIGSVVGNAIDPQIIKGPRLGDGQTQTAAEGVFRPIVLGTGAVMGNIIHRGPEVVRTHRQRQSKGGGPKTEEQRRYRTFAIRVAEGPIAGILRIWMDEKLVYDIRPESTIPAESAEFADRFRLYLGNEDQLPDPDIEAYLGIGNVNAYRGTAYVVFPNFDLTDYGDRIPQLRFEVSSSINSQGAILALGRTSPVTWVASSSEDGDEWGPLRNPPMSGGNIIAAGDGRFLIFGASNAYYSDDLGVSWEQVGGASFLGAGVTSGTHRDNVVVIAASLYGYYVSVDNGETFETISPPGHSPKFVSFTNDGVLVACGVYPGMTTMFRSANMGQTWSLGGELLVNIAGGGAACSHGEGVVFGGSTASSGSPAVHFAGHGFGTAVEVLPASAGNMVLSLVSDGSVLVAGTDAGELYWRDSSGWHKSFVSANSAILGIAWNGEVFVAVSGQTGAAQVLHSRTGKDDWIQAISPLTHTAYSVAAHAPHSGGAEGIKIQLPEILSFLHSRVGMPATDFDLSDLEGERLDGIVLSGDYSAADCIRTLMPVYMLDASEHDSGSGYRLNYVKRGGPVVATITADDLVDEPEESVREDALERPKKLHLHFQSPTVGYAPAKATSMRNSPDVLVTGEVSASVPVVFSDVDEAWRRAGVMHQVAWSEVAGTQELVLSDAWLELVPTDCIGLVLRDQQRRLRITKIEHVDGTLKCDLMTDRQSSYTSSLTGIPLPEPTPPPPSIAGPTVFAFLDIPALTDAGDRLLYYIAVSGQTPAWYGAVIQRSMDGGANYEDVLTAQQNTIMGTLLDPVSSASEHYTDTTNVARVQLFTDDEIQSLTQQQFLSEGGAFALEKPGGGWEVMQYRDAEDEGDGVFALTTLLRGRLNSGPDEHLVGARFVLLDGVYAIDAETAMIGQELTHRAVSLGTSPELGPVSTDTYTAQSQTEWSVAHVLGEIDSGNLPVQIVPRHRFGTEDRPVRSSNWIGYRLTATDGSSSATVTTTSGDHTFNVSGWSTPIIVTASQLNRFTGAGPTVSEEFE